MIGTVGRALLWALLGAFVTPVAVLAFEIAVYRLSSGCGTPGDSGGCEMGVLALTIAAVPLGAGLFFVGSLMSAALRLRLKRNRTAGLS